MRTELVRSLWRMRIMLANDIGGMAEDERGRRGTKRCRWWGHRVVWLYSRESHQAESGEGKGLNTDFAFWAESSRLATKELSRRIHKRCQAKGLRHVSAAPSRVRGWLAGQQPSDAGTKEAIAEVLTEACGEPLTPGDLGFTYSPQRSGSDLPWAPPHVGESLDKLSRSDLMINRHDQQAELQAVATGKTLTAPLERWATSRPERELSPASTGVIGAGHVEQLESATRVFRDWDNEHGGGLRRKAVIGQLNEVTQLLDGSFSSRNVRNRLFTTVADLAQLAGWMAYDVRLHATAQKYYVLGLHLAREAGDRLQGARMLYCLSRQMIELDHPHDAYDLAQLALHGSWRIQAPKVTTMLLLMKARALANLPNPEVEECRRTLDSAHDTFTRPGEDPSWAGFFDEPALAGMSGACLRDLAVTDTGNSRRHATDAEPLIKHAIDLRSEAYLRSHVFDFTTLAGAYVCMDEPEQAAATASTALDLAGTVRSARVADRLSSTAAMATNRFPGVQPLQEVETKIGAACRP